MDEFKAWAAVARYRLRNLENAKKWFGDDERTVIEWEGKRIMLKSKYDRALEKHIPYVEKAVAEMEKLLDDK